MTDTPGGLAGSWTMGDAVQYVSIFLAIQVTVFFVITKAFILMIPQGERCPLCDGHTLAIEQHGWWRVLGARFRRSWCLECGWEGVLQRSDRPTFFAPGADERARRRYADRSMANSESHSGQLPLNSKKSSK